MFRLDACTVQDRQGREGQPCLMHEKMALDLTTPPLAPTRRVTAR